MSRPSASQPRWSAAGLIRRASGSSSPARPCTGERPRRRSGARPPDRRELGAVDELVLRSHRLVDRIARWAWLGAAAAEPRQRRFLIVQIDGLSRAVLDRALKTGHAPSLARLLRTGRLAWREMSVGLPSSTPAFQAAALYGVQPDIPGFHYFDKRAGLELHFPRHGVADLIEQRVAEGRRGILEGGACYACVFTGGADESLMTFARLMKPTRAGLPLLRMPLSLTVLAWAFSKCLWMTGGELVRFFGRAAARANPRPWRWLGLKIFFSIWVREHFTLGTSGDIYRGVPRIYLNYLDYDVFAHSFGPGSRAALRALRRVDRSIGQLARLLARVPELGYDLYVLSDHGQVASRPFPEVAGGRSIDDVVREHLAEAARRGRAPVDRPAVALPPAGRSATRNAPGAWQRFLNHFERSGPAGRRREPMREPADETVRVVAAGPNAFVYFTESPDPLPYEEIERRYPGVAERLSTHRGIGLVLARSGPGVCWWRGRRVPLDGSGGFGPFADRPDRDLVLADLRTLMAMPSAGDLVLYGTGAAAGDVSYIDERGAHAGPAAEEMKTFFLHPPAVEVPQEPLTHPIQLYPHFLAYSAAEPGSARAAHDPHAAAASAVR